MMGTNYYVELNFCKSCGKGERTHIGKLSHGWQFLIRWHKQFYDNFQEFTTFLKINRIVDESDQEISYEDFIDLVNSHKKGKVQSDATIIDGHLFLEGEFS